MLDIKKMLTKISDMVRVTETQVFTYGGKSWQFRRIGKIVFIEAASDIRNASQGLNTIGTLRESMRPEYTCRIHIANSTAGVFLSVEPSGTVNLYMPAAVSSANNNSFSGCYIAVGGGYCLNGLKAVFSMLSAIAERRWHHVKHQEDTHQTAADVRRNEDNIHADKGNCLRNLWRLLLRAVWAVRPLTSWLKRSDRKLGECSVQSAERNQTCEQSVLGRNEWRHHGSGLCGSYRRRQSERSSVKSLLRSRCVLASVAPSEGGCF